ncbi:MAG: hypothetical protein ACI81P_003700 [Neolewinella sp.]|jgi:hypothetical protein
MSSLASLSVEQLHNRFMLEKAPYWWLYNATRKEKIGNFIDDDESVISEEERLLYAWLQLEELLNTIEYGRAKVILKKNKSDNVQNSTTLYVQWGTQPGRASIGSSSSFAPASAHNNSNMLLQMLQMQEKNFERQEAAREAAHAREMGTMQQLLEAKFTAQTLESEIEGMGGSTISEDLLRGFVDIAKTMVMRPGQPAAALGTLGQGSGDQITAPAPPSITEEGQAEPPGHRRFSVDLALQHIAVIRKNLPEHNVNDVIEALALFTQQQPDQARNVLGMLMQNKGE